jgi:type II secretion system protein H
MADKNPGRRKMNRQKIEGRKRDSARGITLIELLAVVAIMAILSVIAIPHVVDWRNNIEYRIAARAIVLALREARSRAICTNREHRIEIEQKTKRIIMKQGDRPFDSTDWNTVVKEWNTIPEKVLIKTNVDRIHLNPNGTANGGTITIQDTFSVKKYEVRIGRTGRVRIS